MTQGPTEPYREARVKHGVRRLVDSGVTHTDPPINPNFRQKRTCNCQKHDKTAKWS